MVPRSASRRPFVPLLLTGVAVWANLTCFGCASAEGNLGIDPGTDPLVVARDPEANIQRRLKAIDQAWAEAEAGRAERSTTREALKSIIWTHQPTEVRLRVLAVLLSDLTEDGLSDTRNMMRLRLPTETDWQVIDAIGA